jgi:hypothetical protein
VRLLPVLAGCCLLLLASCGKEQEPAPPIFEVQAPDGEQSVRLLPAGMEFSHPSNWRLSQRELPAAFELTSGGATVAGWAYAREEELPDSPAELETAKDRLIEAIEERDPEYEVRSAKTTEVAGAPAIEVRGEQVIAERRLRTRSVHVFEGAVEYVIEALSPPQDFPLTSGRVLEPLLQSLELEGEIREGEE